MHCQGAQAAYAEVRGFEIPALLLPSFCSASRTAQVSSDWSASALVASTGGRYSGGDQEGGADAGFSLFFFP